MNICVILEPLHETWGVTGGASMGIEGAAGSTLLLINILDIAYYLSTLNILTSIKLGKLSLGVL